MWCCVDTNGTDSSVAGVSDDELCSRYVCGNDTRWILKLVGTGSLSTEWVKATRMCVFVEELHAMTVMFGYNNIPASSVDKMRIAR